MTPCEESVQLGAYLLGALDPEERAALERHIAGCDRCKAELVGMAPLPGLLRHTPFEELDETAAAAESLTPARRPWHAGAADADLLGGASASGGADAPGGASVPPQRHRRPRRRMVSAGLVLAGAAAVAGAWVYAGGFRSTPAAPPAAAMTWFGQDPTTHVTATAALTPEAWGTQMDLKLGNLPIGVTCHLVVHARDGRSETAGTWGSGYGTKADIPASTSISPSDIGGMDIVGGDGNVLVHVQG